MLAEKLLAWLRVRYEPNSGNGTGILVYPVLVYQYGPNGVRDKTTAKKIIRILENHGWLLEIEGGAEVDGKYRQEVWRVHHALWEEN